MKYGLLAIVLLLWGCPNPKNVVTLSSEGGEGTTTIDFTKLNAEGLSDSMRHQDLLPLTSLAEEIQVVKLETGDHCLVDGQARYFVGSDFILVAQKDQVMLFGKDGHFRKVIARNGRGPGEYDQVDDMAVDEEKELVYLLSEWGDVRMYSLSDTAYFRHFKIDRGKNQFYKGMMALEDGKILLAPFLYKNTEYLVFTVDTTGDFLNGVRCPSNDYNLVSDGKKIIYGVGNEIFYISQANDTIYRWTGETLVPHWIFRIGNKKMNVKGESQNFLFLAVQTETERKEIEGGRVSITYSNRSYCFDKKKGELSSFTNVWDDHLLMCYWDIENLHIQDGEHFYWVYSAPMLDELIPQTLKLDEKDVKPGLKARLKELQKTLSPDDNPVLLVGRLKS